MTEFVEVTVKLPKIEGYEYSGEFRPPKKGDWWLSLGQLPNMAFVDSEIDSPRLILRPIKPATVTVTLRREDAVDLQNLLGGFQPEIYGRVIQACKAALGEQKCGEMPAFSNKYSACNLIAGHAGPHNSPTFEASGRIEMEKCGGMISTIAYSYCALPRGHAGNHVPESLP